MADESSNREGGDRALEFLRYAICYLENRIAIVDNRASILLAVQGILFGLLAYAVSQVFSATARGHLELPSAIVLGIAFMLFVPTVVLLLQTVRPSKKLVGLRVPRVNMECDPYVMWFTRTFPSTPEDYRSRISQLELSNMRLNYEKMHFITLQLIRRKYMFYRWAAIGMKLLVLWSALGIALLSVLRFAK